MLGWVLISESALSFFRAWRAAAGADRGNMLAASRGLPGAGAPVGLLPGGCISLALLGVNMLGDALRDYLDPRMQ